MEMIHRMIMIRLNKAPFKRLIITVINCLKGSVSAWP